MSFVKFATICDGCGKRSAEYQAFPHCRECGEDFCHDCRFPGSERREENTVICNDCATELAHLIGDAGTLPMEGED